MRNASASLLAIIMVLLALPAPAMETADDAPAPLVVADPAGDPSPNALVDAPNPVGSAYPNVDIERFLVHEERPDSFRLTIDLVGRPATTAVPEAVATNDLYCSIDWRYGDRGDRLYRLFVGAFNPFDAPGGPKKSFYTELARIGDDGREVEGPVLEEAGVYEFSWDPEEVVVSFRMSKAAVPVDAEGRLPSAGDVLVPQRAHCVTNIGYGVNIVDRVDLSDAAFAFTDPGPGTTVRLGLGGRIAPSEGRFPVTGLGAGEQAVLPFEVENLDAVRRIVSLSPSVRDDAGTLLDWPLVMAPRIDLGPRESRTVNLVVQVPDDAAFALAALVQVDLEVVGLDAPARAAVEGRVLPVLGPGNDTYTFHVRTQDGSVLADHYPGLLQHGTRILLSLLDEVEGFDDAPFMLRPFAPRAPYLVLDPLAGPARLDPDGVAELTLALEGDAGADVRVLFEFLIDRVPVAHYTGDVRADGTTTLRLPIVAPVTSFLLGSEVAFGLKVEVPPERGNLGVRFDPAASSFSLPLLPVAEQRLVLSDGQYLPTLGLAPGQGKEVYVNRGVVQAFDLIVANEGVATDDLSLSARVVNATGWDVDVVPGRAFRVPAGNATMFGVEVVAPRAAAEGDRVEVVVEAVSEHDPAARASLRLSAVVTELPLPERRYDAGEGQLAPLEEAEESPPVGLAFVALFLLFALARLRRPLS
ncbi:MAG: hypothetical protein KY455_10750 [Euryarchaeota archaeon]|nr:hypothetical protein [Euryarchaeota archaeon]